MSNADNIIDQALGILDPVETELKKATTKKVVQSNEDDIENDYKYQRENFYGLVERGQDAIDGILELAKEGEHPRAYEVAAQLIKVVGDTNKELIDLHKKVKDIQKDDVKLTQNNTTNNAIYVGSTNELQSLINQGRSSAKRIDTVEEDIIDHEWWISWK